MAAEEHISVTCYQWQFSATLVWWVLVRVLTKKHLYDITNGSVFTRPSWLPSHILHQLQAPKQRKMVFLTSLVAMAAGGWGLAQLHPLFLPWIPPQHFYLRFFVALTVSLYHLVESSVTHRHGEYPLLYNCWAMCLPSAYASAASWGIAVHFVFSTGWAKLVVGGKPWMTSASTMKFYLTAYYEARTKFSRPFLPFWNRWACQTSWAGIPIPVLFSVSTIALECGLVPLTLLLSANLREIGSFGMIFMHIGIFIFMSKKVGLVFATTLPTYIVGFRCTAQMGTGPWWCAVSVAFLPTMLSFGLFGGLLPENWPSSPVSLFMWSGDQAKVLAKTLMTKETRVVLGTSDKTVQSIVGLPVIHHGAVAPAPALDTASKHREADQAVHDCVLRVIGFTILQHKISGTIPRDEHWDANAFVKALQNFLETEWRLFETQSGHPLVNAYFVRVDGDGNVDKVLSAI